MKNKHYASIGNAFIWAAAIIATAMLTHGAEHSGIVVVILGGAAGSSIILVGNALRRA
jgi:hypothetical protein